LGTYIGQVYEVYLHV